MRKDNRQLTAMEPAHMVHVEQELKLGS